MEIRDCKIEDIEQLTELLATCHKEMNYELQGLTYNKKTMSKVLSNCVLLDTGAAIVVEDNNKIIGVGMIFFCKSYMDSTNTTAIEAIWHTDPKIRKTTRIKVMKLLLRAMEKSTSNQGIKCLRVGSSVKYPAMSMLLEQNGYQLQELSYTKEVL